MANRVRVALLVLGPAPIVVASVALSAWMRAESDSPPGRNSVLAAPLDAPRSGPRTGGARPATPPAARVAKDPLRQLCQEKADLLRGKLAEECTIIVREPFVLAGDMTADKLIEWHKETIGPTATALGHRYFKKPPTEPITVLLFTGETAYNHYAHELYGDENISIYGYYKPRLRTLIMNIGTGGGTLVHELTHALMDFDFPRVPDWFNEGLASLHEQCRFRSDRNGPWIEGRENWRLPGLQDAIKQKRLRSLSSLIADDDFRGEQEGLNYAQARYFCLYMQRNNLLHEFYRRFRTNSKTDTLGHATVKSMFPDRTWEELDRDFQDWAAGLVR